MIKRSWKRNDISDPASNLTVEWIGDVSLTSLKDAH